MKDLLEYLTKSIVDEPEKIEIKETEDQGIIIFSIKAGANDIGKLIGKGGKIIKSLRSLMFVRAIKENKKIQLLIEEKTTD